MFDRVPAPGPPGRPRRRRRALFAPVPFPRRGRRSGVEPMSTSATACRPGRRDGLTIGESIPLVSSGMTRRRAPGLLRTWISVRQFAGLAVAVSKMPDEELAGRRSRPAYRTRPGSRAWRPSASSAAGRSEAGVAVRDRAADRAPVPDLRVADLARGVREQRELGRSAGSDVATSWCLVSRADGDVVARVADVATAR